MKVFVIDTNVLLYDPESIFNFGDNLIVIPFSVIEELDSQKRRMDSVGRNARETSRILDSLRKQGCLSEGIPIKNGGIIKIELNNFKIEENFPFSDTNKKDNRILNVAYNLCKTHETVILVTKDLNLRIMADVLGVYSEDYFNDKIDFKTLYSGIGTLTVLDSEISEFYENGFLIPEISNFFPNQYVVLKTHSENGFGLSRFDKKTNRLMKLQNLNKECCGIRPLNMEQKFAVDLLLDDSIHVVTLVGKAGTGKTLLALSSGLEKLDRGTFSKILVTRPVVSIGNDLGSLPGDKTEKIRPWVQPIYDNLDFILYKKKINQNFYSADYFIENGQIEFEVMTYIRGRSIPKQFIIVDDAQNMTPHEIKTMISRVGVDSKIIFTGDPQQIDNNYLDENSNGLSFLVERIKKSEISGHVKLIKGERSQVAELVNEL